MQDYSEYQRSLEDATPLTTPELNAIEDRLGFSYRQAIGELIYALVTCRPDISFACIKLSQYSAKPASIHFEAVKRIYQYLHATKEDGISFWRDEPRPDLPIGPLPVVQPDNNYCLSTVTELQQTASTLLHSAVDSDHAGDQSHRKSVSGICLKLAGGCILYKTQYQAVVALSTQFHRSRIYCCLRSWKIHSLCPYYSRRNWNATRSSINLI